MRRTDAGHGANRPDPDRFPIDPDVDSVEDAPHHPGRPRLSSPLSRWPTFEASIVALVFVGGCSGGLVRYLAVRHWPASSGQFPWSTLVVNVAGAFVLSSDWEGLPTVLIEALYVGLAIVATDCGEGVREILEDGMFGEIVPVGDAVR